MPSFINWPKCSNEFKVGDVVKIGSCRLTNQFPTYLGRIGTISRVDGDTYDLVDNNKHCFVMGWSMNLRLVDDSWDE